MRNQEIWRIAGASALALAIAALAIIGFGALGAGFGDTGTSGDQPIAAPIRVKTINGETRITVSAQDLATSGIDVEALQPITHQEEAPGLGTVISPQTLGEQRRAYQAAAAEAERSEFAAKAARLEVQRLQPLHRADRIVSDKALETAESTQAVEEAALKVASTQFETQRTALVLQWGPAMGKWLIDGGPELDRIVSSQDLLVQIALPAGSRVTEPGYAAFDLGAGAPRSGTIISAASQVDSRFQGPTLYALLPADARLQPGMTVLVKIAVGTPRLGVLVPEGAVVRWQGRSWVFVQAAQGEFTRRSITTDIATPDERFFVTTLAPGTQVVVRGAQLLLSEEMSGNPSSESTK